MTDYLVFNHHSLPFDDRHKAGNALPDFLKTCIEAQNIGLRTILVDQKVDASWFRLELAPGFFFQDWFSDGKCRQDLDVIRAFRSIATRSPLFDSNDIIGGADLFEVSFDGRKDYDALNAAAWHEAPITSLETRPPWISSPLRICLDRMNPGTGEIESKQIEIANFYN